MASRILAHRLWLNGKECDPGIDLHIKQEQDYVKHPITGEWIPGYFATSATMRISGQAVGKYNDLLVLASQRDCKPVTLARAYKDSVAIARDLRILEYDYADDGKAVEVTVTLSHGAPLERVPLDEWLASQSPWPALYR